MILWWLGGVLTVSAALAWYALDRCYCYWHDDWASRPMLHVKSLSTGCEAVSLPEPWRYPDGEPVMNRFLTHDQTGETFEDYEFRKSPHDPEEVLIALTNRPAFGRPVPPHRTSLQQYAFRFPALTGHPERRITGLRRVSPAEWAAAAVMTLSYQELVSAGPFEGAWDDKPLSYAGKSFDKAENYYWPNCPGLLSPGGHLLAVMSYGPRKMQGGEGWAPTLIDWHRYTVDLYKAANGRRIGRVRLWGCYDGLNDTEWHGDKILTVPREQSAQHFIVCGLH